MTKIKMAEEISARTGMSMNDATTALNAFVEITRECLGRGEKVSLRGFGTFRMKERKAKKAYDFMARKTISLPMASVPEFVFSGRFAGKTE